MSDQESTADSVPASPSWNEPVDQSMQPFAGFDISHKKLVLRLILNKFFGLLTFGFYRFWGKTHVRRQMWQAIKIGQDRLEYHGTAKELFLGFLIAMVILSLLFTALGIFLQFLVIGTPALLGIEQVVNFALLYGFWQFARYRLWRYRLSRTSLRTIRFFLQGKALVFVGKSLLWSAASLLTLGWAYPHLRAVRADYQFNNVAFGDQNLNYRGDSRQFYKIYWPVIVAAQCLVAALVLYIGYSTDLTVADLANLSQAVSVKLSSWELFGILSFGSLILFLLLVFARVAEFRYVTGVTTFAGARFSSNLPVSRTLLIFGIMAVVSIAALVAIVLIFLSASQLTPSLLAIYILLLFFGLYVVFDLFKFMFLVVPLIKIILETLSTDNVAVFEEVAATAENSPKYGEGLADALDVGAF